jgi:hypothetical protein
MKLFSEIRIEVIYLAEITKVEFSSEFGKNAEKMKLMSNPQID